MRATLLAAAALTLAGPAGVQAAEEPAAETGIAAEQATEQTSEEQRIAELEAQLAAQQEINALLKQRIRTLEGQRAGGGQSVTPAPAARAEPAAPDDPALAEEEDRALERALERRGSAVLPPWRAEIAPGFVWSHSGSSGNNSRQDSYSGTLDARLGVPGGWMFGVGAPLIHRDISGVGENTGFGDVTFRGWKSLRVQDETWPSIVASLRYTAPTGEDFSETDVPTGSGFHRLGGSLSAVKTYDPIAFFGDVSYSYAFERSFDGVDLQPGSAYGFGLGASLAVTPEISMSTSLSFTFTDEAEIEGSEIAGSSGTFGIFEVGAGILVTRDVFLSLSAGIGVTDDSPDVTVGMSVPIRF